MQFELRPPNRRRHQFRNDTSDLFMQHVLRGFDFRATELAVIAGPPTLDYSVAGTNLVFAWSMAAHGFNLQAASSMAPGSTWTSVPTPPVLVGDNLTVAAPMTSPSQFYRLVGPSEPPKPSPLLSDCRLTTD